MNPLQVRCGRGVAGATCFTLLAFAAPAVLAHGGDMHSAPQDAAHALMQGFGHPFTGGDHLAAMLAVGVWGALTMRRHWLAPLAFASAVLAGALLAMAGWVLPAIEPMIAVSLLVLGLLIAVRVCLPVGPGLALAAGFALFHGAAHGQELAGAYAVAALAGMVGATVLLHAGGIAIGLDLRRRSSWLARVAGVAVAALGASLLLPLA